METVKRITLTKTYWREEQSYSRYQSQGLGEESLFHQDKTKMLCHNIWKFPYCFGPQHPTEASPGENLTPDPGPWTGSSLTCQEPDHTFAQTISITCKSNPPAHTCSHWMATVRDFPAYPSHLPTSAVCWRRSGRQVEEVGENGLCCKSLWAAFWSSL